MACDLEEFTDVKNVSPKNKNVKNAFLIKKIFKKVKKCFVKSLLTN